MGRLSTAPQAVHVMCVSLGPRRSLSLSLYSRVFARVFAGAARFFLFALFCFVVYQAARHIVGQRERSSAPSFAARSCGMADGFRGGRSYTLRACMYVPLSSLSSLIFMPGRWTT